MPPYSTLHMEAVGFSETLVSTRVHSIISQNRVTLNSLLWELQICQTWPVPGSTWRASLCGTSLVFEMHPVRITVEAPTILTEAFRGFIQTAEKNVMIVPRLWHNWFLQNPFNSTFINHPTARPYTVQVRAVSLYNRPTREIQTGDTISSNRNSHLPPSDLLPRQSVAHTTHRQ
jgi:hypothetical protein